MAVRYVNFREYEIWDPPYRQKKSHYYNAAISAGIDREQIEAVTDEKQVGRAHDHGTWKTPERRGPRTEPMKFITGLHTNTTYNPIP